jgi:hypothetical protein
MAIQYTLYRLWVYAVISQCGKSEIALFIVCWVLATLILMLLLPVNDAHEVNQELRSLTTLTLILPLATPGWSIQCHLSLDFVSGARPSTFPGRRLSRVEIFNFERASSLDSPPENALPETDCTLPQSFRVHFLRNASEWMAHLPALREGFYRAIHYTLYRLQSEGECASLLGLCTSACTKQPWLIADFWKPTRSASTTFKRLSPIQSHRCQPMRLPSR